MEQPAGPGGNSRGCLCLPRVEGKVGGFQSFLYMVILTTDLQVQGEMLEAYTYVCCESLASCLCFLLALLHPSLHVIHSSCPWPFHRYPCLAWLVTHSPGIIPCLLSPSFLPLLSPFSPFLKALLGVCFPALVMIGPFLDVLG